MTPAERRYRQTAKYKARHRVEARLYYLRHRESINARRRKLFKEDEEYRKQKLEQNRASNLRHKEKVAARKKSYAERNAAKIAVYQRGYKKANREKLRIGSRRRQGMMDATAETRTGACPLCEKPGMELVPDHSHRTGKTRDWICHRCNLALGAYQRILENGMARRFDEYLERYGR